MLDKSHQYRKQCKKEELLKRYLSGIHDGLKENFPEEVMAYFFPAIGFKEKITPGHRRIGQRKKPTDVVHVTAEEIPNNQLDFSSQRWGRGSVTEGLKRIRQCEKTRRGPSGKPCMVLNRKVYEQGPGGGLYAYLCKSAITPHD